MSFIWYQFLLIWSNYCYFLNKNQWKHEMLMHNGHESQREIELEIQRKIYHNNSRLHSKCKHIEWKCQFHEKKNKMKEMSNEIWGQWQIYCFIRSFSRPIFFEWKIFFFIFFCCCLFIAFCHISRNVMSIARVY